MKIIPIPCLSDNYSYLIVCEETGQAGVVDPSEGAPVLECIKKEGVELKAVYNTHHHLDHIGGIEELKGQIPGLDILGHSTDRERIPGLNRGMEMGQTFSLGELEGRVLHNPGHTSGGVSYVFQDCVFTGDTLFAAGCGRLFEGAPAEMHNSLHRVIGGLPETSRVYFGHEYTLANLRFAQFMEPDNQDINERLAQVEQLRKSGGITTPTRLSQEWRTNPFLRCDSEAIREKVRRENPAHDLSPESIFGVVRSMKDVF